MGNLVWSIARILVMGLYYARIVFWVPVALVMLPMFVTDYIRTHPRPAVWDLMLRDRDTELPVVSYPSQAACEAVAAQLSSSSPRGFYCIKKS